MEFVLQHSKQNQHQAALIGAAHTAVTVTEQWRQQQQQQQQRR
jgi:hypothetical protein